ncbi:MAG TPA: DinB family protein [Anaerolineae bacterium]|nr:DinB family protein [Anaerolineae bacterium]
MTDLKTRLVQLLALNRTFQQQLMDDLESAERNAQGTWENWSLKDELAHVVAWQLNALARLAAQIHGEPVLDFGETEKINRAIYDTNRDRTLTEIAAEGDRAYADFMQLIASLSEDDLTQPARFSTQEQRSLADQILGNGYEHAIYHYAEHYRRRGDLTKATQLHEASVSAVADWPEQYGTARYNLACFYAVSGQKERAIGELREALQLRPDLIDWSKQDADLTSLHEDPAFQALYT